MLTFKMPRNALISIITLFFLSGCAGVKFQKPDPNFLRIGQPASTELLSKLGTPSSVGEYSNYNQIIKKLTYTYAESGAPAKYENVLPARSLNLHLHNNILVGYQYSSSFADDATDFDESKVSLIIKNKSSRSDVVELLGKPSNESVFPMIPPNNTSLMYTYNQYKQTGIGKNTSYTKSLVIGLNSLGIVTILSYSSSGEK